MIDIDISRGRDLNDATIFAFLCERLLRAKHAGGRSCIDQPTPTLLPLMQTPGERRYTKFSVLILDVWHSVTIFRDTCPTDEGNRGVATFIRHRSPLN